jgi:hypothetical protein
VSASQTSGLELGFDLALPTRTWWAINRAAIVESGFVFATARVVLSVIAIMAAALIPVQTGQHDIYHLSTTPWLDVWARWDSVYFVEIAQYGYGHHPYLAAFFPLYPILIAALSPFLAHDGILAGVVVSSFATFVALVYLFKLATLEFGEEIARRAVLYVTIYPMALFLMAVYSESTYLAPGIAAFYYARRRRWWIAALAAFLAGLARVNSVTLFVPLDYEAWRQTRESRSDWRALARRAFAPLVAAAAAPLALLTYAGYLAWLTGDLFAYFHRVGSWPWGRHLALPWATLLEQVQRVLDQFQHDPSSFARTINTQDLVAALILIGATIVAWWRLPRIYTLYMIATACLLLSTEIPGWTFQSMARYTLTVFPLYFLLAQLGAHPRWHRAIIMTCAPLLGMYTALFAQWYWVF